MNKKEPNAVCRQCGKPYYVCNYCTRVQNYMTYVCSQACYEEYTKAVLDRRKENADKFRQEFINVYTSRHDLTPEQYNELMSKPINQVAEETKAEFKEYFDKYPGASITEIVSIINKEINEKATEKVASTNTKVNNRKKKRS